VLVIKKRHDLIIDKNIARIFRGHNIVEYKSPDDYFSARDFLQVCAYTNHYAANTPGVDDEDMSITFVGARYSRTLLQYLAEKRKYTVTQPTSGIYLIHGDYLPIQIVESKRLPENESLWLKSLRNGLRVDSARAILMESDGNRRKKYLGAYLDILLRSNWKAFMEARNMARHYPTLEEAFTKIFPDFPNWKGVRQVKEESRAEGIAEEKERMIRNLLAEGMSIEQTARLTELPPARVRALKKSIAK
jgi:hypothetical protein